MPRDISGNYTLPAGNPVVTSTTISTTWANSTLNDIAVALTNSLSIDGSVVTNKIADSAVTTAKINDSAVTTLKIDNLAVSTAKIADSAVTTAKINDLGVTTAKINDLGVTTAKINDLAVTAGKLADDAVETAKILDAAVTASKIGTDAVTTTKIIDDGVTPPKMAGLDVDGMVARISATEFEGRTITGTAAEISVANGDGVSGNPTLSLAAEVYKRANILGTVSQSGGVPTGAIIERGSNANGEYVRYADGTQICFDRRNSGLGLVAGYGSGGLSIYPLTWTFPAAFSNADPQVAGSGQDDAQLGFLGGAGDANTTGAGSLRYLTTNAVVSTFAINVIAIGRWF